MTDNYWTTRRVSRRTMLRGSLVGFAGLSAAALIGCGGSEDAATSTTANATPATKAPLAFKRGGIVRMGSPAISGGLDPVYSGSGYHKTRLAFDTLLDTDDKDQPGIRDDALAASMELVDPTTVILKLRPGVKFHDGTPFNSEAVKFNVGRTLQATPPGQPHKAMLLTTDRIEAVDELTVKWILKQPDASLFQAMSDTAGQMLSPTHYAGKALPDVQWKPVGTGRYMFKDYSAGAFVKYQVNKDHWFKLADGGPAGMVDEIHELEVPDDIARASSLQADEQSQSLDMLDESPVTQLEFLNKDPNLTSVVRDGFAIRTAYINHGLKPLDNVDFRRALMWAWDPVAQNKVFDNSAGKVATSALSSLSWAHIDVPGYPTFDLEKAKMFMERSGVAPANRKVVISGDPLYFQLLQESWNRIGVTSEFVTTANAAGRLNRNSGAKPEDINIHMSVGSRITSRAEPNWQLSTMLRSDGVYNYGWVPTGKIDELTLKGVATYNLQERKDIYAEIQRIHADQLYCHFTKVEIPFYIHGQKPLVGFRHFPNGRGDYRYIYNQA